MVVRNEVKYISSSLGSVLAQEYPENRLEVVIADGMSDDGTRSFIEKMQVTHGNIRVVDNAGRVTCSGLNRAIHATSGEIVIRVDGHTTIAPDYVQQCVSAIIRTGAEDVGGRMSAVGEGRFGKAVAAATSTPFGVGGARFHYSTREEWVDTVYLGAWKREVFERLGGFDEELGCDEDDEFNYRLRERGGRILLSPMIHSRYSNRSSAAALWKQYFKYGVWKVRVLQKHPRQMRPRQFVPPTFALSLILSLCFTALLGWGWICLAAIAGTYTLANLAASLATAARKGWRHLPLLPMVHAILHLSYGLGFLAGLLKFWNRWGDRKGRVPQFDALHGP